MAQPRWAALVLAPLLIAGCSGNARPAGGGPDASATGGGADAGTTVGQVISFTPAPDDDPSTIPGPRTDAGDLVLAQGAQFQLLWSPPVPGPMTAAAACTRWVTSCVVAGHLLDDCARSVPACATDQPWDEPACCPVACYERYAAARQRGVEDVEAFLAAFLGKDDPCIPGMAALLGGQP